MRKKTDKDLKTLIRAYDLTMYKITKSLTIAKY